MELQKIYEELVEKGLIKPVSEVPTQFRYPTLMEDFPTYATNGTQATSENFEKIGQ